MRNNNTIYNKAIVDSIPIPFPGR